MDKKLLRRLFVLMFSGAVLVGCGEQATEEPEETNEPDTEAEAPADEADETEDTDAEGEEIEYTVDIIVEDEAVADLSKEIVAPEDMYLLDAMKENYEMEESGGFVEEIEGYEQDEDEDLYWLYYVNDEEAEVGAADFEPEENDEIEWRLESFE